MQLSIIFAPEFVIARYMYNRFYLCRINFSWKLCFSKYIYSYIFSAQIKFVLWLSLIV